MGRRWGKTVLGTGICISFANAGGRVAWIAPEYRNTRALWRAAKFATGDLAKYGMARVSESDRFIEFTHSGGFLGLYSGDNPDAMRGEWFHLVVEDEAARLKADVHQDVIQPTLADVDGESILISTPKGKNWFWQEFMRAKGGAADTAWWQEPSSRNPNPNIKRAALLARDRVPDRTYRQEWLAEFVEDGGGVFRRVTEQATAQKQDKATGNHRYVCGADWGKSNDFTVFSVWDTTIKALCYQDRSNMVDYAVQVQRLQTLHQRFRFAAIYPEMNSMGQPICEQLQRLGLPVYPFTTTQASKSQAVDALALALERGEATIINDPVLVAEMQAYESERLPSGLLRYSAPAGMHDDCVMAACIGWQGIASSGWSRGPAGR